MSAERPDFTHEITVWCRACGNWEQTRAGKNALRHFRSLGWANKRGRGWLCPGCLKEEKNETS